MTEIDHPIHYNLGNCDTIEEEVDVFDKVEKIRNG